MLSERTIINGLILAAGLILGPYLVVTMIEGNEWPLLTFAIGAFLLVIFFAVREGVCVLPLLGTALIGKLNFLPLGFTSLEVFSLILIFYYGIAYLAMRQRAIDGGPWGYLVPALIIAAIVFYHDHTFGLHAMGSSQEGSRPGLLIAIAIVTYICGINIPTPSRAFLRRLPWYCFLATCLASIPFVLTTYVPSLTPFMYHFVDTVNVDAFVSSHSISAGDEVVGRLGFQAGIGAALQVFLVSHFSVYTWWRPTRWFVAILSLGCLGLVMSGGYRSGMMLFFFVTLVGAFCYGRRQILFLFPVGIMILLGLTFVQDSHPMGLQLPMIAQRSLSFFPGNWDMEAVNDAKSSNEFRDNIQRVYVREYLLQSPYIGNGFTFDPVEAQRLQDLSIKDTYDHYYQAKSFIITKTFHIGWISLYDAVGLIGCLAFVVLGFKMLWTAGKFVFNNVNSNAEMFPLKVWLFCNIAQILFGYFTVFGTFSYTFPSLCAYSIVLVHLGKLERRDLERSSMPRQKPLEHILAGRLFPA